MLITTTCWCVWSTWWFTAKIESCGEKTKWKWANTEWNLKSFKTKTRKALFKKKVKIFLFIKIKHHTLLRGTSVLCPCGLGGTLSRGSFLSVQLRPYIGVTESLLIDDLQTGHVCIFGRVSSHWCKQGLKINV